jgi:hypothetical protein
MAEITGKNSARKYVNLNWQSPMSRDIDGFYKYVEKNKIDIKKNNF